jgi:hypothetical protein
MLHKTRLASGLLASALLSAICSVSISSFASGAEYGARTGAAGGVTNDLMSKTPDKMPASVSGFDDEWKRAAKRTEARAKWEEIAGWKMIVHVSLQSELNSASCKPGDPVWGLLDDDLKWGAKLIAARNSLVKGHIVLVRPSRTLAKAIISSERRLRTEGSITIKFDQIEDPVNGTSWPIDGKICRWDNIVSTTGGGWRQIEVDKQGRILKAGPSLSRAEQEAFFIARVATFAPIPGSMWLDLALMPVAMGIAGAAYPSFVYEKPVNLKEKNFREKAFAYGFVTNLPGAAVVEACVQKGQNSDIRCGDQIAIDLTFKENPYYASTVSVVTSPARQSPY